MHDVSVVTEVLIHGLRVQASLSMPVRLGLKKEDSKYPRPLCLTASDDHERNQILKESKNLSKHGEETINIVFIKKDMTETTAGREKEIWIQETSLDGLSDEEG